MFLAIRRTYFYTYVVFLSWLLHQSPIVCATFGEVFWEHTRLQSVLDFRPFLDMPLVLGIHMDPKLLETEVGMVLDLDLPEIQAPVTLSESQGTKILVSKISSQHLEIMLFYAFWGFVMQKMLKIMKNCPFLHKCSVIGKRAKKDSFSWFWAFFCITNPQNA